MGWGASTLVSTADDVVSGTGKFEQLEVRSILMSSLFPLFPGYPHFVLGRLVFRFEGMQCNTTRCM